MHQSISTIDAPEFINLQPLDINPLMSSCEIKVFYLGKNRNKSFIDKEVATEMAKTLRGAPIVGYYKEKKEDFADHGEKVIIDDEGMKFENMTVPYGFVAPDAKVWFKKFQEEDELGNPIIREYLMTTGYLWTGQFPEANLPIDETRPHSMELDEDTLKGDWATDGSTQMEFFIINDAIFSKLCILGEDVEPCFEGSTISAPEISTTFSKVDDNFKHTLFTMMEDLKKVIKGGNYTMETETTVLEDSVSVEEVAEAPATEEVVEVAEEAASAADFSCKDKDEDTKDKSKCVKSEDDDEKDKSKEESKDEDMDKSKEESKDEEDKNKDNYSLEEEVEKEIPTVDYEAKYNELLANFTDLQTKCEELTAFKNNIENIQKEELINAFTELTDEDKAEVIENKANYSLDEIKAKLSVIYVDKKVNFDLSKDTKNDIKEEEVVTNFNLNEENNSLPSWVQAVMENEQ